MKTFKKTLSAFSPRGFSLIELLVVISIILVLAGLLMPAFSRVRKNQQITNAKGMIHTINIALSRYYNEYGAYPPVDDTIPRKVWPNRPLKPAELMGLQLLLSGEDCTLDVSKKGGNPKKLRFIELPDRYFKTVDTTAKNNLYPVKPGATNTNLVDPWGNSYMVAFDPNLDKQVSVFSDTDGNGGVSIDAEVGVWSGGPDGKVDTGETNPMEPIDEQNKDNITSWN
jgi:prepilin-type N-terminal cleavage/methylation domain-containing protein